MVWTFLTFLVSRGNVSTGYTDVLYVNVENVEVVQVAGFVFSRPRLVLRALECVYAEPNYYDLPDSLASVVEELVDAGLAERVSVRRGGTNSSVVRLSVAGKARLCAAQDAALSVAAGVSLVR